jgi:hypothetical protein
MLGDTGYGYGTSPTRRGRGNVFTRRDAGEVAKSITLSTTRIVPQPVGSLRPARLVTAAIGTALGSPAVTGAPWTARG